MNEHKDEETYETFDITDTLVCVFFLIVAFICLAKHVDVSHVRFEFKLFERQILKGWTDLMMRSHPYDYNSKMARSTDVCASKIRNICNKI